MEELELQAIEQRNRLHAGANELREKIAASREKLKPSKQVREHFLPASILFTVIGLGVGYSCAGMFTPH